MTLLDLYFIEPSMLARCNRDYPQIIKLLGFLLRIFKEAGIDEKDLVSMFDRRLDE